MRNRDNPYVPNIRSQRNADLEAEMKEYDEARANPQVDDESKLEGGDPVSPATTGWEKRYADLRSFSQRQVNELKKELEAVRTQLKTVTHEEIRFPKTEEEVMEWAAKYPDVAGMIKTIALKEVQGVREEITTTRQQIADEKLEAAKARAFGELMSEHPDFLDIRETEEFHTWAEGQAKWVRDALYENDTDAQAAIAAVDLFKFKTQKAAPKKATPKDDRKDAARGVGKSMTSAPDTEGRRNVFRESDLAKMDRKEYAKLSDEIDKAMREGRIDYDLSKPQSAAR